MMGDLEQSEAVPGEDAGAGSAAGDAAGDSRRGSGARVDEDQSDAR
jgi:hypothetical protein